MGARAQVKIEDTGVYLYTHWGAGELHGVVASAIKRGKERWGDPCYLTRIIFSEMIKDDIMEETGFGICDKEHGDIEQLIIVDCEEKTIRSTFTYHGYGQKKEITFQDCLGESPSSQIKLTAFLTEDHS